MGTGTRGDTGLMPQPASLCSRGRTEGLRVWAQAAPLVCGPAFPGQPVTPFDFYYLFFKIQCSKIEVALVNNISFKRAQHYNLILV